MKKNNILKIIIGATVITASVGIGALMAKSTNTGEKANNLELAADNKSKEEMEGKEESNLEKKDNKESKKEEENIKEDKKEENKDEKVIDKSEKEIVKTNNDKNKSSKKEETEKKDEGLNKKTEYLNKMKSAESKANKIASEDRGATTPELSRQARDIFDIYDAELNAIYGELKSYYKGQAFEKIKNSQIQWLKKRDNEGQKVIDGYAGGREGGIAALLKTANLTKERCYDLINTYMK